MKSIRSRPMEPGKGLINGVPHSYAKDLSDSGSGKDEVRGLIFTGLFGISLIGLSFLIITGVIHIGV